MMPKVIIILDKNHLLGIQKSSLLVEKVADYPLAYQRLIEAIHAGQTCSLHIRDEVVGTWFTRCAQTYGESHVTLRDYTPRDALRDKWQIVIPSTVTDREILQSELLDAQVTSREGQEFWDAVLAYFYDDSFSYRTFPLGNISTLLNNFHRTRWEKAEQRILAVKAKYDKLAQWERNANSEVEREIVQRLAKDPASLRKDLIYYKVLQNYPPHLGKKLLKDAWELLRKIHLDLEELEYATEDVRVASQQIVYYLNERQQHISSTKDIEQLLEEMSGYLYEEFTYVESIAEQHPEYLTHALLQQIAQRFRPLKKTIEKSLVKLHSMLEPAFPSEPHLAWNIAEWLEWIIHSYMPYYSWLDAHTKRNPSIEAYASLFADWFYDQFITLKNGAPQYFAFNALYQERERMTVGDGITLVLIVDNLNFAYFDELKRQFQQQNFVLEEVKPLLSLVPTATEVAKAALIAGQGDQVDIIKESSSYTSLTEKTWNALLQGKKARYLQNIGELQRIRTLTHDVYFLNYLPIDEELHKDNRDTGRSHTEIVYDYLTALSQAVAHFAQRFQIEQRLAVYVISDHGSTRIPRDTVNVIDKKLFKKFGLKNHHRFMPLSDETFTKLPGIASTQCYLIARETFKTSDNYLIARGYYRFLETLENFYVHGGLTPEEVVVPFARFICKHIIPEDPMIDLLNKEFRYAVPSRVMVELGNPNAFPLEALTIRLVDADASEAFLATLGPRQVATVELVTRFRKAASTARTRPLTLRVHYEYQGHKFALSDQPFEITMKSLMEVNDDDFDL
jgi:hypothetical protein